MPKLHIAHTSPLNPPNKTPILTQAQVWSALQRKIHHAQEFVPAISSCTVLSSPSSDTITREVIFAPNAGHPKPRATETVKSYHPSWVEFHQEDGTVIRNIISVGGEGEGDLYLTYVFEFEYGGSEEVERERVRMQGMARGAVKRSVEVMREMVGDGRIE